MSTTLRATKAFSVTFETQFVEVAAGTTLDGPFAEFVAAGDFPVEVLESNVADPAAAPSPVDPPASAPVEPPIDAVTASDPTVGAPEETPASDWVASPAPAAD